MPDTKKISIVMPSYNEEEAISIMIDDIRRFTKELDAEIVIVDSSKDRTSEIAESMGARVIRQEPRGHGLALRTAISEALGDIIITADCDNTYPMSYIPRLVSLCADEGYDLVSCCRMNSMLKKNMPISNQIANRSFAFLVRLFYKISVHDVSTGMFCMKRTVNDTIQWETNYSFPCEIIIRSHMQGFRCMEIDIPYNNRIGDITLNKWRSGKAYLRCIFKYKFSLNFKKNQL